MRNGKSTESSQGLCGTLFCVKFFKNVLEKGKLVEYNENTSNKTQILSNHPMCLLRYSEAHQNFKTLSSKNFKLGESIEEWKVSAYDCSIFALNFAYICNIMKKKNIIYYMVLKTEVIIGLQLV